MSSGNFLFCSVPPQFPISVTRIRNSLWGDFLALGKRILRNLTCPFFSPIQNAGTDAKLPIATGLPGLRPAPRQLCSTSQLFAATLALENASQIPVASNGTRIPNSCLMAEAVMNDARHTFLMFAPDFCNPAYKNDPLYDAILAAFEPPFKGRLARETVHSTKQILGIIVAFGGQWPHSTT